MMIRKLLVPVWLLALGGVVAMPSWATTVEVRALFNGSAMLMVDGKQRLLKQGQQSEEGVELLEATSKFAVIKVDGKQQRLTMTRRISSNFTQATTREVRLSSVEGGHYVTPARINNRPVEVMVDTGATSVAINSIEARKLGIDYQTGTLTQVSTANGIARAYRVMLSSVAVGTVTVNNVEALITEGSFPQIILLGNSYLSRVQMKQENGVLVLETKF